MASQRGHAEGWEGLQFSRQRTQKKGIKVSYYRKQCVPLGGWGHGLEATIFGEKQGMRQK